MIVLMLADNLSTVQCPSIASNDAGHLMLCEDGLGGIDRSRIWYRCPECGKWLFKSDDLDWAGQDGYWKGPGYTLTKLFYDSETEIITCPDCRWTTKLEFFSTFG